MSRFLLDQDAKNDLRGIQSRIARDRPNTSVRVVRQLRSTFQHLADFSEMGRQKLELGDERLRVFTSRGFTIIYRVGPSVTIIRVLARGRDVEGALE